MQSTDLSYISKIESMIASIREIPIIEQYDINEKKESVLDFDEEHKIYEDTEGGNYNKNKRLKLSIYTLGDLVQEDDCKSAIQARDYYSSWLLYDLLRDR